MKSFASLILFLSVCVYPATGQLSDTSDVYREIMVMDSLLFDVGFSTCDVEQFERIVSEDFEFYHDQSGIIGTKEAFITNTRDGLCTLPYQPIRRLVEGSTEIYPLKKNGVLYGAVQSGIHEFYAKEPERPAYFTSIARFTHVWLLEEGEWKLSRVLSFDHGEERESDE